MGNNLIIFLVVKILLWAFNKLKRGENLLRRKTEEKLVKQDYPIEFSGILIIILKLSSAKKQKKIDEAKKQYELFKQYKNLNPKYFENIFPLKKAKLKVHSSDIIYSSKYNIVQLY